jgi:hypothetical protein
MPTYKNEGKAVATWEGTQFNPGVETEVSFFVPEGVYPAMTKTADAPPVSSPVIFTGEVSGAMDLPYAPKITLSVQGVGTLYLADDADGIAVNGGYTITAPWSKLGKIRVEDGALSVVVERAG